MAKSSECKIELKGALCIKVLVSGKYILFFLVSCLFLNACLNETGRDKIPNILFALTDDQGYPHSSAYGCQFVKTPGFDRVADEGVLFRNTYCAAPQCSPNRASILTGRYLWQINEAGSRLLNHQVFSVLHYILQESPNIRI